MVAVCVSVCVTGGLRGGDGQGSRAQALGSILSFNLRHELL